MTTINLNGTDYDAGSEEFAEAWAEFERGMAEAEARIEAESEEYARTGPLSPEAAIAAILAALPQALDAMPEATLARMAPYLPQWEAGVSYSAGDRVGYGDVAWRCLVAHGSQGTWAPDASPSLWARVLIPDPDVVPEWEQPGSTNPYSKGDRVTHGGQTWVSTVDNNVWEPGSYGWEVDG